MTPDAGRRVNLSGVWVDASSFNGALARLDAGVRERRSTFFSNANVYSFMLACDDPAQRARLERAGYVMADGMPIVWLLRALGHAAERVHGDDFMLAFIARFPGARHFLLGGAPGQAEVVAAELRRRFPGIAIAGTRDTPVRPVPAAETQAIVSAVRAAQAEVVWVGMGTPEQDRWMAENAEAVGVPLVGVGSAFDVLAGKTRATPAWMKRSGLQWLHRLAQEPRRLGKRYLYYNPRFVLRAFKLLARRGRA
jgi:N-acetylglucosaminyldiphosphoundecaprenol N-acetyl-beta-D-mannosaminyltransferase